jgi:uncharacterized membrane protein
MDPILMEWGGLLLRWVHIITGIAWIGSSFYFMHIDATLRAVPDIPAGKGGETWEVHGGGFYHVRKYLVAPEKLPDELIWHKWEAYATWVSGFFLLVWIFYLGSELYLIDPAVRALTPWTAAGIGIGSLVLGWIVYNLLVLSPLAKNEVALAAVGFAFVTAMAWFFQQVFSGRGALIHTGAMMGTIMSGNVAMNIIPNQRKVIADLIAGRAPNPEFGKQAKTRSRHNNYLTLPVLFCMLSGHYPLTFTSPYAWVMIAFVLVAGAAVRHFYNERHAGRGNLWWTWGLAAVCMLAVVGLSMLSNPLGRERLGLAPIKSLQFASAVSVPQAVEDIVSSRCAMCHSGEPLWPGMAIAPKGVRLDSHAHIAREAEAIRIQAVLTNAMPPNNVSQMTLAERRTLGEWLKSR